MIQQQQQKSGHTTDLKDIQMSPGDNYILPCYRPYGHTNVSGRQLHTAMLQTLRTYKCLRETTTYCHATDLKDIQMSPGDNYILPRYRPYGHTNVSGRQLHTATLQTLWTYKCLRETTTYCHATDLMDIQMSPGDNYILPYYRP